MHFSRGQRTYYLFSAPWFEATKVYESTTVLARTNRFLNVHSRLQAHAYQLVVVTGADTHVFQFTPMQDEDSAHVWLINQTETKQFWVPCPGAASGARLLDADLMAVAGRAVHQTLFLGLQAGVEGAIQTIGFSPNDDLRLDLFRFGCDVDLVVIKHSRRFINFKGGGNGIYVLVSYPCLKNRRRLGAPARGGSVSHGGSVGHGGGYPIRYTDGPRYVSEAAFYDKKVEKNGNLRAISFEIRGLYKFNEVPPGAVDLPRQDSGYKIFCILRGTDSTIEQMRKKWEVIDRVRQWMHKECLPQQVFDALLEHYKQRDPEFKLEYVKLFAGQYDDPYLKHNPSMAWCIKWLALAASRTQIQESMGDYAAGMLQGRIELRRRITRELRDLYSLNAGEVLLDEEDKPPAGVQWGVIDHLGHPGGSFIPNMLRAWVEFDKALVNRRMRDLNAPRGVGTNEITNFVGAKNQLDKYNQLAAPLVVAREEGLGVQRTIRRLPRTEENDAEAEVRAGAEASLEGVIQQTLADLWTEHDGFTDETISDVVDELEEAVRTYMSCLGGTAEQWRDLVTTYDPEDESETDGNAHESVLEDLVALTVNVYMALDPRPELG